MYPEPGGPDLVIMEDSPGRNRVDGCANRGSPDPRLRPTEWMVAKCPLDVAAGLSVEGLPETGVVDVRLIVCNPYVLLYVCCVYTRP